MIEVYSYTGAAGNQLWRNKKDIEMRHIACMTKTNKPAKAQATCLELWLKGDIPFFGEISFLDCKFGAK